MTTPFLSQREAVAPADLIAKAQEFAAPRVAIARAGAPLPMEAAKQATEAGLMIPVFVGEADMIRAEADKLGWDISAYALHDTTGEEDAGRTAAALCGAGEADVLMKGQLHTDVFMKTAVARDAGLRTGNRFVHIFHITHPDGGKPLLVSDAALNVSPDIPTRQSAILEVEKLLHALGNARPKIAILSATESAIPSVPSSMEAKELADWAAEKVSGADVSGPLALDLILSPISPNVSFPADWAYPADNDVTRAMQHIGFTAPFNIGEQPAISVPCASGSEIPRRRAIGPAESP